MRTTIYLRAYLYLPTPRTVYRPTAGLPALPSIAAAAAQPAMSLIAIAAAQPAQPSVAIVAAQPAMHLIARAA